MGHKSTNEKWYERSMYYLFENNYGMVYKFIYAITFDTEVTKDATQETFIKAFASIDKLRDKDKFIPWLKKIAVNTTKDFLRNKNLYSAKNISMYNENGSVRDELFVDDLSQNTLPENIIEKRELQETVFKCLEQLTFEERQLVYLRYYDDLSFSQISEITEITEASARMKLTRIRRKINNEYSKGGSQYDGAFK